MQHDGGRLPGDHGADHPGAGYTHRKAAAGLHPHHEQHRTLTRLGLFCETMRLFLRAVSQEHPELRRVVPEGLVRRYLKEEAEATDYEDARSGEGRRRLGVCARDVYRLVDGFRGTAAAQLEEYRLLERLLREQCVVGNKRDGRPEPSGTRSVLCNRPTGHLQRAQRQGVRGTGGGDLPCGERHPVDHVM